MDSELNISSADLEALKSALTPRLTKYIPYEPTPKQTAFLLMNSKKEVLYGGAAGGGKSIAQMMAALQFVDIPGYSAILFRKTFADLTLPGALISIAKEWLMPWVERGEVKWSEKEHKFTFPSGATLAFGYLESENDCYRYRRSIKELSSNTLDSMSVLTFRQLTTDTYSLDLENLSRYRCHFV